MNKTIFFLIFLAMAASVIAVPAVPFYGSILIDNQTAPAGTIVTLYINGTQVDQTTTPSTVLQADNEYSLTAFGAQEGDLVTIEVYDLDAYNYTITALDTGGNITTHNVSFSVNTSTTGTVCTYNESCTTGVCCSGTCQASCSSGYTPSGGGGGGGGGGSVSAVPEEAPPAPATTTGTFFGGFSTDNTEPEPVNTPPTFGEPATTTGATETQIPPGEDTGLTPAATGLFKIGDMDVSWQQLAIGVLFLAVLIGGGYYSWKNR